MKLEKLPLEMPGDIKNKLFYGDNITFIKELGKNSVDLIYLDPPFNSNKNYNIMYSSMRHTIVPEQIKAFNDTWHLDYEKRQIAKAMPLLMKDMGVDEIYVEFWRVWMNALQDTQPDLLAYLIYMVERLLYLKNALRPTGSIYFHCDPTASHYLKVMMDGIFGHRNFRNEIIWKRTSAHNSAKKWGDVHDVILFYTKSDRYTWNKGIQDHSTSYVEKKYTFKDDRGRFRYSDLTAPGIRDGQSGQPWRGFDPSVKGRHWGIPRKAIEELKLTRGSIPPDTVSQLEALYQADFIRAKIKPDGSIGSPEIKKYLQAGQAVQDIILDIFPVNSQANERRGFPTQKPTALLERILSVSTNEGDIVLDPFCGSGTTIVAAQKMGRKWIGCDIAILPIKIATKALRSQFKLTQNKHYELLGIPSSLEDARILHESNPEQFEHWIIEKMGGLPLSTDSNYPFDGVLFNKIDDQSYIFPLFVKQTVRPSMIRHFSEMVKSSTPNLGFGIVTIDQPSNATLSAIANLKKSDISSIDAPKIQILTVSNIIKENQSFDMGIPKLSEEDLDGQIRFI